MVEIDELAEQYTAILEYELPLESRRPDVVLPARRRLVVIDSRARPNRRGRPDQAAAYARDLRCYHGIAPSGRYTPSWSPRGARVHGCSRWRAHCGTGFAARAHPEAAAAVGSGPLTAEQFLAKDAYARSPRWSKRRRALPRRHTSAGIHRAWTETRASHRCHLGPSRTRSGYATRHLVLDAGSGLGSLVGIAVHNPVLNDLKASGRRKPPGAGHLHQRNGPLVDGLSTNCAARAVAARPSSVASRTT